MKRDRPLSIEGGRQLKCVGEEFAMTIHQNLIAGEWVGTDAIRNINPSNTDDVVGEYHLVSSVTSHHDALLCVCRV